MTKPGPVRPSLHHGSLKAQGRSCSLFWCEEHVTCGAEEGRAAPDLHRGAELGHATWTSNGLTFPLKQKQEQLQFREASGPAVRLWSWLLWLLSSFVLLPGA